ncbi:MAG: bifunctional diaminohydroxyphosphoribosylaminopyrimidine deaminase/5-amino-6-(5-phosphoribosylamino)uracil reductase RibD [Myxococcota bacterium]
MTDDELMGLAIDAARRGRPSPNPHVGAVVATASGELIATGHHEKAGEAHAEVAAIGAAAETRGHTLYVTMEPCNHHGRTPPCTEAIIAAGLVRVVIGARDPAPHVPGAIERMQQAGIEVVTDVRGDECRGLIADFTKHIQTGLPYIHLKAAVTLDGRMATRTGDSKWITGTAARTRAHVLRDQSDAILVGIGTVLADDPALTVRHVEGIDPLRVVFDTTLQTPTGAAVAAPGTLIFHQSENAARIAALESRGVELVRVDPHDLKAALEWLGARDVVRLLVEGGPSLHGAFLDAGFADYASVFVAPRIIGDVDAKGFAAGRGVDRIATGWSISQPQIEVLGTDVLMHGPLSAGG